MKYKTELHCHSKMISPCSNQSEEQVAEKYIKHGYTTLVLTNHAAEWNFDGYIPGGNFEERVNSYFSAADAVRDAADGKLNVICGMELSFHNDPNDYLVYGITKDQFLSLEDVFNMRIWDFADFARNNGLLLIQAHPFRFGMRTVSPDHLNGYEVMNGHILQHSHNDVAEAWAKHFYDHDPIMTSGSDNHYLNQEPNAGIITDDPIKDSEDLLAVLKSRKFELIRPVLDEEHAY